jgi:pSer/pThr/pTyr-binding forkhead associated (FHA) protein
MSKIRIANGPYRGREKTLAEKALTIGRDAEAGIQILDRSASRFHAEIFPVGGMYFVRDLDSKNGTYVNDEKIGDEELLRVGDVIKIGSTELVFEIGNSLSDDDSSDRISYRDDPDLLSNTLEFRLDELSDIAEPKDHGESQDHARSLRMLYQVGRLLSDNYHSNEKELKVLELLVSTMPAESALVFRRDTTTGKLIPSSMRTSAQAQPVISRSIIKKTFSENKAIHIANAQDDDRFDRNASVIQKGIRSVICVPYIVGGQTRGVLYVSRGSGDRPFDQIDLELVSACAIQLGMAQFASEQQKEHNEALWKAMAAMVRALESRAGLAGSGERCARFCVAVAAAMGLDPETCERLSHAGLLHHLAGLAGTEDAGALLALDQFVGVDHLETVLPMVRTSLTADAGKEDLDTETNVLIVATSFERAISNQPDADVDQVIKTMLGDARYDIAVTSVLERCHLDGSLYNKRN